MTQIYKEKVLEPLLSPEEVELIDTLRDMNEIQKNLAELVESQQSGIDTIENNIIKTEELSKNAIKELQIADSLFFSYKPIILGGIIGGIVGGPIPLIAGFKYAAITGSIGTIIGSYGGYKIQKT